MDCYRKVLLICYCQVKPFRLFCKTEEILVCETAKICSSLDSSALHLLGCVACTQRRAFIVACVDQAPCQAGGYENARDAGPGVLRVHISAPWPGTWWCSRPSRGG